MKQVGRFDVEDVGIIYDGDIPYKMIILTEFDKNDKEIDRRVFYFRISHKHDEFVIPNFSSEEYISKWFVRYKNYSKFECTLALNVMKVA